MRFSALAGCALLAAGASAAAQDRGAEIDQDLRCAVWASVIAGSLEDPAEAQAFTLTMTYFLGRLEQRTGVSMDAALTSELTLQVASDMASAGANCQPLMVEMGQRLIRFGEKMQAIGEADEGRTGS